LHREERVIELLRQAPLFSRLERPELRALASLAEETDQYQPGEKACRQGEPGHRYYIVEEGILRLVRMDPEGRVLEVGQLGAGDAFGQSSLLLGDVHDVTVEATEPSRLLYIEREAFEQLLEARPRILNKLQMRPEVKERRRYPRFGWMEAREIPVKMLKKHPAVLIVNLLVPVLAAVALLLASVLAARLWRPFVLTIGLVLAVVPLLLAIYVYIDWINDLYIVTNRRVAHRERVGITQVHLSATPLQAIQDVQEVQAGLVARLWQFGDVIIDAAGGGAQVVFQSVPNPGAVRQAIFEQRDRIQALARAEERQAVREAMRSYFLRQETPEAGEQKGEERARPGCLTLPLTLLRGFLPPMWHREGSTITWRKHWMALIRVAALPVLIFLLTTILVIAVSAGQPGLSPPMVILYAVATFILAPWFLWQFENWQNDFYRVTASRVIHVERTPFLLRESRREASLEQITNVRSEQSFFGSILRYGDVFVETASPEGTFHFRMVSRPAHVQQEIFAHIESARRRRREREAEQQRAEMLDWFSVYDEIRRGDTPSPLRELPEPEETE